jgi:hypothetical protein
MQCKQCGYWLWNIQGRECPECGKEFKPSEFDFIPNSVAFCCPHCDQNYFGTDERGQLVPRAFECITCQNQIDMDEMVLRPRPGFEQKRAHQSSNPWQVRKESKSSFRAWLLTCWRAMIRPNDLVQKNEPDNEAFPASISFLFFNNAMIMLLGVGLFVVLLNIQESSFTRSDFGVESITGLLAGLFLLALAGAFAAFVVVAIWSVLTHVMLRLLAKPKGVQRDTLDCLCYSNGVTLMTAVPICGFYALSWVAGIWWPISAGFMLAKRHQVSIGRAMMAVWVFPIIVVIGMGCLIAYGVHQFQQQMANFSTSMVSTDSVGQTILKHINDDQTIGPDHVLRLMVGSNLHGTWEYELADQAPADWGKGFQEGCNDLSTLIQQQSSGDARQAHIKHITDALDRLPPLEGAGYRFGSVLFLYNKVTTDKLDPALWLLVVWPRASHPATVDVFFADGKTKSFAIAELIDAVDEQDVLRNKLGLPEIGSLDAVTIRPLPLIPVQSNVVSDFESYDLSGKILAVKNDDGQIGPNHVLQLLMQQKLSTAVFDDTDLDDWNSYASENQSMGNWHNNWFNLASDRQRKRLDEQLANLPKRDGAGYRFGQMVMVYDGIVRDKLDDRLWLAVRWPKNYAPEQTRIFLADGRMIHVLAKDMPRLLVEQDQLRSELGLPRILDLNRLDEVKIEIPQVGDGTPYGMNK